MRLNRLFLENFRNYHSSNVEFNGEIHCLLGRNGCGKTNVLESIHYLSVTRSSFQSHDSSNIRVGANHFIIRGEFSHEDWSSEIMCKFEGHRKKITENGNECQKLSDHIGKYPVVMIAPHGISSIWEGNESRRRLFDTLLCQADRIYLENLQAYNHFVRERNSLLRQSMFSAMADEDLLDSYHEKMAPAARIIHQSRSSMVSKIAPLLKKNYEYLCNETGEEVDVIYSSDLYSHELPLAWKRNVETDRRSGRTSIGVHRDRFLFALNGNDIRDFGSQGQQKSFLIALKLAENELLTERKKIKPVLLLDDIFDKLDLVRMEKLIHLIRTGNFGQLFITDARPEMSRTIISETALKAEFFHIEKGIITRA